MKTMKKVGAIVLALCMCMSLCVTAFAASSSEDAEDPGFSITITNASAGNTYTAYKIFDVTYDGNGNYSYTIKSDNAWHDLFETTGVGDLECPFVFTATTGTTDDGTTIYNVTIRTDSTTGVAYSDEYIISYLQAAIEQVGEPSESADGSWTWNLPEEYGAGITGSSNSDGTVTIYVDDPGYYFVTTTNGSVVSITTTEPQATITDKNEGFDLKKEVKNGLTSGDELDPEDETLHEDAEAIGDDVEFTVTANVPLYTSVEPDAVKAGEADPSPEGYLVTNYAFVDHMSAGLEIRDLVEDADYTVTSDGRYLATNLLINQWVTIYDGGTDSDGNPTTVNLTEVAYNVVLELTDVSYYIDDDGNEQIQFDGFTLSYDTLPYTYDENGNKTLTYIDEDGEVQTVTGETFQTAADLVAAVGTNYPTNASIKIDYFAHVTEEATYDNTNEITMEWLATAFRHPNPLEPQYNGSEKDDNDIYVLELDILKVSGTDETTPLAGAVFTLEGTNLMDVVTNSTESYASVGSYDTYVQGKADGLKYWFELNDGTYTDVDPYDLTDEGALANYVVNPYYDEDGDPYGVGDYKYVAYVKSVEHANEEVEGDTTTRTVTGTTQADGTLTFTGLTVGDWTLTEITAPEGYNLLTEPIEFTISVDWTLDETTGKYAPVWTINQSEGASTEYTLSVDVNGHISITIINNTGTLLPGTGGMGTTIFYVVGAILICGAAVVLITRRRMAH